MRKLLCWTVGMLWTAAVASAALPEQPAKTGDRSLDRTLQSITAEAKAEPSSFWSALSKLHGIPEPEIQSAREATGLQPADMYMASAIAHLTQKPIGTVAEAYSRDRDKGWGVIAKEMGIKPGSPEFHRLKADARGSLTRLQSARKERQRNEKARLDRERKGQGGGKKSY